MAQTKQSGSVSVNGVEIGFSRSRVESVVGEPAKGGSPAWNRYGPAKNLIVMYRPKWPELSPDEWPARMVVGSQLELDGSVQLTVGSPVHSVEDRFGPPDSQREEDEGCLWEYPDFYVTLDRRTAVVRSIGLKRLR